MRRGILFVVLILIPVGLGYAVLRRLPDVGVLEKQYPKLRYRAAKDGGTDVEVSFSKTRPASWASLSSIPRSLQGAVVTSEDWAFFQHEGFDFKQIREAVEESVEGQGPMRGASTLSQQTVKNIFLSHDRSWMRKLGEAWLTHRLEAKFSKKKILEIYLNIVELGSDVVGVGQAARHYFQKPVSQLNPRESAYLAYLLPSPRRYSRSFYKGELTKFGHAQVQRNLDRMRQGAYISSEDHQLARESRLSFEVGEFAPVEAFFEEGMPPIGESLDVPEAPESAPDLATPAPASPRPSEESQPDVSAPDSL